MTNPTNIATPGGRFRAARKRAGMSQTDVAREAEVAQSTISDFENGKGDIFMTHLTAICLAVTVPVDYILRGSRVAQSDQEAEALALLREADDRDREQALNALRGMLGKPQRPFRKQGGLSA